ncbi:hypothetical protein DSL92_00200 [Billgrantia gudaonensis]|uniref:Uncharacterized protein n=1 Tax=Billgrantia gudaonensis TaxID=376427 RepID=A0A432JMA1_9GAMM|nr:hypothetical protein DSL92_00200 [Halomonas gudaonensis]
MNLSLLLILPGVGPAYAMVGRPGVLDARPTAMPTAGLGRGTPAWLCLAALALPMALFPDVVLALFLHDPALVALSLYRCSHRRHDRARCCCPGVFTGVAGRRCQRTVMTTTTLQWLVLPAWWVGVALIRTARHSWVQLGYRCLNPLWFALIYSAATGNVLRSSTEVAG